eukprot:14429_1
MASPQQQPQQEPQQQQQPRQQVTINAALDTLCTMFESVDRDVIHMILIEGCGGNMESAVEALLTMTGGISTPSQEQSKSKKPSQQQQQQSEQQLEPQLINLPDDFLRPPSYFLSKYESSHEIDVERAQKRQIIEDEIFAKAIFEDSLFTADLHANPEWVLEEINKNQNKNQNKNKYKYKNKKFLWRDEEENGNIDLDNIDPSDLNARKISFKQRFNTLGNTAKQKLGILAHKLQRNKQESKLKNNKNNKNSHQYRNVLTSLDDEALIDEDDLGNNAIIEVASEDNRGTYIAPTVPQKPTQQL